MTIPPKVRVLPAEPRDGPALAKVEIDAFSEGALSEIMFGPASDEAIAYRGKELTELIEKKDPRKHYVKAVVGDDEKIIALGIWQFFLDEEGNSANCPETQDVNKKEWPPGANLEACKFFFGNLYRWREERRGQRHAFLSVLVTDPAHQGIGAGSALMKYGLDIADREKIPSWLESSRKGYPLYRKFGFQDTKRFTFDLTRYGREGKSDAVEMVRPQREN
ncbi:hypothetical protein AJ79_06373 [Helicocarpus griseus UAMH5409]|uniref:N-acetyltransferase domain-containing protein n=1 Tax=Helicocarpus griseus UAMH5409 TaxID=1447875 RepID=A0A2B7XDS6_9EURO|nr:hypothetical protein AJ79_06373 [Helicocarpus griseus UAMH5409]